MIAKPVVVSPHPDSPTRPTHSPASIVIEKSSTAVTKVLREENWTLSLSGESSESTFARPSLPDQIDRYAEEPM
jgi:hypothetical protein